METWAITLGSIGGALAAVFMYLAKRMDQSKLLKDLETLNERNLALEEALRKKNVYVSELEKALIARDTPDELAKRLSGLFND